MTILTSSPRRKAHSRRLFWGHVGGVSAVEFALILPIMLTMYAGMAEMAHAIDNWRKVTSLARTVADLTSQGDKQNPISSATMNDILASSATVLLPFHSTTAKIVVSALSIDATALAANHPRVCSSVSTINTTARTTGIATALAIPAGFGVLGARYIVAEVSMPYAPMLGSTLVNLVGGINGSINLNVSFPWPTRGGQAYNSTNTEVILPGGAQCP